MAALAMDIPITVPAGDTIRILAVMITRTSQTNPASRSALSSARTGPPYSRRKILSSTGRVRPAILDDLRHVPRHGQRHVRHPVRRHAPCRGPAYAAQGRSVVGDCQLFGCTSDQNLGRRATPIDAGTRTTSSKLGWDEVFRSGTRFAFQSLIEGVIPLAMLVPRNIFVA